MAVGCCGRRRTAHAMCERAGEQAHSERVLPLIREVLADAGWPLSRARRHRVRRRTRCVHRRAHRVRQSRRGWRSAPAFRCCAGVHAGGDCTGSVAPRRGGARAGGARRADARSVRRGLRTRAATGGTRVQRAGRSASPMTSTMPAGDWAARAMDSPLSGAGRAARCARCRCDDACPTRAIASSAWPRVAAGEGCRPRTTRCRSTCVIASR